MSETQFTSKREISMKRMLTVFSEALDLPELNEGLRERNIEFEAALPDVRIDCLLFLTPKEMQESRSGPLKHLGTINVLHIKAIGDKFTEKHLQTYLGQGLIINGSDKVGKSEAVILLIISSERPTKILEGKTFAFQQNHNEPWIYENQSDWFFPVKILVLNDIDLTEENLSVYFPFVPFISDRDKFLEFFPKIATLPIPEVWKFFCDLFASRTNPLYEEVRKMTFWLTADDIQKALEHVQEEEMPAVIHRILGQMPCVPSDEIVNILDVMKTFIPKQHLKEWAREILDESE